ncbi:MAG: hypothetical protein AVDCRST_MAG04-4030, partial [uncultured Acetobacteraceae bacterium]
DDQHDDPRPVRHRLVARRRRAGVRARRHDHRPRSAARQPARSHGAEQRRHRQQRRAALHGRARRAPGKRGDARRRRYGRAVRHRPRQRRSGADQL